MQINSQMSEKSVWFEVSGKILFQSSFNLLRNWLKTLPPGSCSDQSSWVLSMPNRVINLTEELSILFYWSSFQSIFSSALYTMATHYNLLLVSETCLFRREWKECIWTKCGGLVDGTWGLLTCVLAEASSESKTELVRSKESCGEHSSEGIVMETQKQTTRIAWECIRHIKGWGKRMFLLNSKTKCDMNSHVNYKPSTQQFPRWVNN